MDILQNPYVIISCCVVIGLLAFFLGRQSNKQKHSNPKTVHQANDEILQNLKHSIAENKIPNHQIVENLRTATAQKYNIDSSDIYESVDMVRILSKEILETDFISAQQKLSICDHLNSLVKTKTSTPAKKASEATTAPTEETVARDKNLPDSVFTTTS